MKQTKQEKIFYYNQPGLYNKKIEELEHVEEKLCWLLNLNEHFRNCDKCLMFGYWKIINNWDGDNTPLKIHSLTPGPSIWRVRQKIQNEYGLFLPTDDDVIKARGICESAVRSWSKS